MADFKIYSPTSETHITPAEGKIKLGSSNVLKIYQGSTLVWPISSDPVDPYTPIDGTARFIATNNSGVITLYDTSFNTVTPTNPFDTLPNSNYHLGGVSDNLTYMVATGYLNNSEDIKISNDGGQTFSNPSSGTFKSKHDYTIASKSGQVVLSLVAPTPTQFPPTSDHNFMLSTDYGDNFSKITFSGFVGFLTLANAAISYGGKFIAINIRGWNGSSYTQNSYLSKDYGSTWNSIGTNGRYYNFLISGNGQYIILIDNQNPSNSLYSSDYGENFSSKNYSSLTNLGRSNNSLGAAMSETGEYYILANPSGTSYVSYGDNFAASLPQNTRSTHPGGAGTRNVRTSNSGETIFWSDNSSGSPDYSFSDDFGATWSTTTSAPSSVGQGPIFLIDVS